MVHYSRMPCAVVLFGVHCKLCAKHKNRIRSDYCVKGQLTAGLDQYTNGTTSVTHSNVKRHLKCLFHDIALEMERLVEESSSHQQEGFAADAPPLSKQPKIDTKLKSVSQDSYKKLIQAAYMCATGGLPLTQFETMVKCLRMTGTKSVSGCDNSKAARKFINELAQSIRNKLTKKLGSCFFSILTDGSQPKKTGAEKEMVMVRLTDDGLPKFFVVGLIDLDQYGNVTSDNLKKAIDDFFIKQLQVTEGVYQHQLISATSDGAGVNTGCKNGLLTQLQRDRDWLVTVHCISHRLELALKDCLLKEKSFKDMKDLMIILYYQFKRSGKLKRQFKELAKVLNATVYAFPKVHGTCFINHVRKGLTNLLNNWPVLKECLEKGIENGDFKVKQAKLQGILRKLMNFKFLASCALLDQIACLSLAFE
ncbi:hypothetical protein CAPTEDRAFT_187247 [Capitella teleta]|uniref:DUF4371 domain-containing protein n=1 Tax=Capitella teleta TaxID=283909 RepID=X1ZK30_CAPTE|nr:hypothetical protein CAPTEDRAFT_187247 [Capitella teleta]|eukprot:ELU10088.1 hypothetical protein CAPTEDRAFT_187247 [Capitella teleta]